MEILSSRIVLRPTDPEASREFYREKLGLPVAQEFGSGPERGTVFHLGGGHLELVGRSETPPDEQPGIWLQVRNLATARAELMANGVSPAREARVEKWGLWEMHIKDPDGVLIYIVEVPQDHPFRHGVPAPDVPPPTPLEEQIRAIERD
ncbi:Catechol 2,3-dioxygenase [Actinopolyspora xinjiangensis]|uniref:Catechol 2,3-dioxygenase n=1 Tax=Actinopolyspora xinjiangensis TaxID=405564 RepID=A0A1H0WWW4_9ACTN|nr:VOC family protein [Actinopolyspora xinjiangensis]SDP95254.1 Catechol 2,3-dioxygenase [Actinopolyspora xinjiangensis]